jgi:2,5-diketo-D-gluconate reductase A
MSINLGPPAVNQCEMCIGDHDDGTIRFCQEQNITYESYGPLRSVDLADPRLTSVATAHRVSPAQVALRWVTQHGCPVAVSPGLKHEYQAEDLGLGAFTLTAKEMVALSAI